MHRSVSGIALRPGPIDCQANNGAPVASKSAGRSHHVGTEGSLDEGGQRPVRGRAAHAPAPATGQLLASKVFIWVISALCEVTMASAIFLAGP